MDLFRLPGVGRIARWAHTRRVLQLVLLAVALLVVVHGFIGPQLAPRNASTVFTWVHYRGLLVLSLLAVGNLFCTACPMMLVRDAGRRIAAPRLRWPRVLRGKWIAVLLFAAVLYTYELFDLWALPRATAWLVLGYFAAALVVDLLFRGATFCKYLCPVGQFSFMASLLSPTELHVRDLGTCRSCRTVDCIKGNERQRGCELALFLPLKVGNMDCTLCLDCVRACPHDNIGLMTRLPGAEIVETRRRSGIGRLAGRPDIAALATLFTFGALLNAFAMTAPAHDLSLALLFAAVLIVVPVALLAIAAFLTRLLTADTSVRARAIAVRYAYALVPLGFAVWLAHYTFHFLTGAMTAVPVAQSAAIDLLGWPALGEPWWRWARVSPGSVIPIQLGFLLLGAAGSFALVHATSLRDYPERAWLASAPWIGLVVALSLAAMWILAQPMDMRGVGFAG